MPSNLIQGSKLDQLWLLFLLVAGIALSATLATSVFDMSVFLSGILCVGLIAIGRREGYLIGLYSSLAYSVIAYQNSLYGEVYLNLLFFVPTGIIGYFMWRTHTQQNQTVIMRQLSWPHRFIIIATCITGTIGLGLLLGLNPDQNTPFVDAATNVLSIVATLLMMWRYKEQWLLYIALNSTSIVMWVFRARQGSESGDLMILMWTLFLFNALFGYWRWHLGVNKQHAVVSANTTRVAICDAA